ncbi:hypothetical protein RRG08_024930 [Elysia crispata]|uniref:Uncharacterized protein n=1 Tax=Elysia crispata TaxID=231223 RepID=A0AAE1D956_9GAST|nr:hypothetical protein RRG08_065889 [Elysia crispata]KAK3762119.1 hypothetical protein RRG08_024930 [Elysia crispata]
MNTFAIFAFVALFIYTVNASLCRDICKEQCAIIQKKTCKLKEIFGNTCKTVPGACTLTCAAACRCSDGCAGNCEEKYPKCKGDDSSDGILWKKLNKLSCGIHLSLCSATCQYKCDLKLFAGAFNSLRGFIGGPFGALSN